MRRVVAAALWLAGSLVGAVLLARALYRWPDLLPAPLRSLGNALVDASGADTAEASADIEAAYVFGLCWLVLVTILALLRVAWRRRRGRV